MIEGYFLKPLRDQLINRALWMATALIRSGLFVPEAFASNKTLSNTKMINYYLNWILDVRPVIIGNQQRKAVVRRFDFIILHFIQINSKFYWKLSKFKNCNVVIHWHVRQHRTAKRRLVSFAQPARFNATVPPIYPPIHVTVRPANTMIMFQDAVS